MMVNIIQCSSAVLNFLSLIRNYSIYILSTNRKFELKYESGSLKKFVAKVKFRLSVYDVVSKEEYLIVFTSGN